MSHAAKARPQFPEEHLKLIPAIQHATMFYTIHMLSSFKHGLISLARLHGSFLLNNPVHHDLNIICLS